MPSLAVKTGRPPISLPAAKVVADYSRGLSTARLGKKYGCSRSTIAKLLQAHQKIKRPGSYDKYALNEHFFDVIDTEEKAYWLGFLLADGCIDKRRNGQILRCRLKLKRSDAAHVRKFRDAIGSTAPVRVTVDGACIQLSRPTFCQHLLKHGCKPGKTQDGHGIPKIPSNLYQHLFRGLFDGDGTIYRVRSRCKRPDGSDYWYWQWRIGFIGSFAAVEILQQWIKFEAGIAPKKPKIRGPVAAFDYSSGRQSAKFLQAIYGNATVALNRKRKLYEQVMVWAVGKV